jgi:hypothetical protein
MARRRKSGVVRLEGFCTIYVRLEGFSIIFFKWGGTRSKSGKRKSEKAETGGCERAKGLTRIGTNFLTTDGHRWTRIKNNDFDANFANYHEFFNHR